MNNLSRTYYIRHFLGSEKIVVLNNVIDPMEQKVPVPSI